MGLKDLMVRIRADNSELDKAVIESSRRMEQVGKRLDRMGRSLSLNVTAPILALGAGAVASSIKFEDAMAGVAKTVDASAETITALGEEFKALSEQIPVAATELANIGEAAGQLGIETSNILGFTRVIADLGVATNLTSTEAATDLARLANITGMPQNAFDRLGSTVVALGNNLATTEREIVAMGLRLAGAGVQVGLTEDQILALAGSLSSVGIEAESGGTALSKVMAEMAIAVGDGGDKLEQFARIAGMSGAEFAEVFETDAADAIVTFVEGLGRLKDEGVNVFQVLESVEFGNIRVRDALLRASGAGDLMRKSLDLASTAWRENTALTIEAEKFYATLGNQLKIVWNQIRNMAAELGDNLKPAVLALIDASKPVLGLLRDMIKGFSELPTGVQAVAIGLVALTAAAGPALVAISSITIAVGVLRGAAALGGLATLLSPAGAIMAGLAALAAMFLILKGRIDGATQSQKGFASATQGATQAQIIMATAEAIKREAEALRELANAQQAVDDNADSGLLALTAGAEERLRRAKEEVEQAKAALDELAARFNELQTGSIVGGGGGGTPTGFDFDDAADKQAALAKQLQDELVAMTKTAVDDMQLDYDRLEAHIIEVDGAISASWQAVLDGKQADIAAVGLAEEFPELAIIESMNAELAKADILEASLGRGFDLVSAKVDILRSALEEMIEAGLVPTNEEYQKLLDKLRRFIDLQEEATAAAGEFGDKGSSFFGGLEAQAKSILDPSTIVSTALGGLLSGGISTALSAIGSGIGGFLGFGGPSDEVLAGREAQLANTEAVKKNIEAANRLADNLNALSSGSVLLPFEVALQALKAGVEQRREDALRRDPRSHRTFFPFDESILADFGLTKTDIEDIAKALDVEFQDLSRDAGALIIAIENINTFNRDFGLLQKQFALFDIEDPADKFASVMDLLASQVSDRFATVLEGLTPENFDAFLEMFRAGFADFDRDLLGDDLDFDQFLAAIGFAESALDGLASETDKATAALRNAPAGFKVALARFTASDPELPQARPPAPRVLLPILLPILPPDVFSPPLPPALPPLPPPVYDWDTEEEDFSSDRSWARNTQNTFYITMEGVQSPREFLSKLEDEVEWRARTGASVIPSKNEMRL